MTPIRRLIAPSAVCLLLLAALPAVASAKQLVAAKVCGAQGCTTFHDAATLQSLADGGPSAPAPTRGAPFYTVRMTLQVEGANNSGWTLAYVPSAKLIRSPDGGGSTWLEPTPDGAKAFARVTSGLAPFPASSLRGLASASAPAPRPAAPGPGGDGFPWLIVALVAAGGGALAGVALRAHRRSRGGLTSPAARPPGPPPRASSGPRA